MATTTCMTAEELWELGNDECRYDLIRGELYRMSPAGFRHGVIALRIGLHLGAYAEGRGWVAAAAETGFILAHNPDTVLGPDAVLVRADRLPPREEQDRYLELAPDLAVEVVSPSDRATYVNAKVMEYLDAGVQQVWIVEPRRRTVTVYSADRSARVFTETEEIDGGALLPDFKLAVRDIFQ